MSVVPPARTLVLPFGGLHLLLHQYHFISLAMNDRRLPLRLLMSLSLTCASAALAAEPSVFQTALPLQFEINRGQCPPETRYVSRGRGFEFSLTARGAMLARRGRQPLGWTWVGAQQPRIEGENPLTGRSSYFIGNDQRRWITGIPNYQGVRYHGLYPGVDLVYHGREGALEYDLLIAPGADPGRIVLGFDEAAAARIESAQLVLGERGEMRQRAPRAYQRIGGSERAVAVRYVELSPGRIGFQLGPYDNSRALVIDPVIAYSTYFGMQNADTASGIAVSRAGDAYVVGTTSSFSTRDYAFVTKLTAEGQLVYSVALGGEDGSTSGLGIAVDEFGRAYLTGSTRASNFPAGRGLQPKLAGEPDLYTGFYPRDAFVAVLNAAGDKLRYATYLGGTADDEAYGIALDGAHNIYLAGMTESSDFAVRNPAQATHAGGSMKDAFIAKLAADGSELVYSTYAGGNGNEAAYAIALDRASGGAYITGSTNSSNFPGNPPYQNMGIYVLHIKEDGTAFDYSRVFGGTLSEGRAIAVTKDGSAVYLAGHSAGNLFTGIPGDRILGRFGGGNYDAIVMKLNPAAGKLLDEVVWGAYLGGRGNEAAYAMAVDEATGDLYVAGGTGSDDFPAKDSVQAGFAGGDTDAFLARFSPKGPALDFATWLGGQGNDSANGLAVIAGRVFVAGSTGGNGFPTANAAQPDFAGGGADTFIARLDFEGATRPHIISILNAATMYEQIREGGYVAPGETVYLTGMGIGPEPAITMQPSDGALGTELGGTRVLFDGVPVPIISAGAKLIAAVAPYRLAGRKSTVVAVEYQGVRSAAVRLYVSKTDLGLFTSDSSGAGQATAMNEDGTANSSSNPARRGAALTLIGTGEGQTAPAGEDGALVADPGPVPLTGVNAFFGGKRAEVVSYTERPGRWAGTLQLVIRVPLDAPSGPAVPVKVYLDNSSDESQENVTVSIE